MSTLVYIFFLLATLFSVLLLVSMPLERLDWWLKVISSVLAGLTVMIGIGAFMTGNKLSSMQAEKILTLDKEVAEARTKQAKAETTLVELERKRRPRFLNSLGGSLKGKPKGAAEILYQREDTEAYNLAQLITERLRFELGWQVKLPRPIPEDEVSPGLQGKVPEEFLRQMPAINRIGAMPIGITVFANKEDWSLKEDSVPGALVKALNDAGFYTVPGNDERLSSNSYRIVVGPKP